MLAVRVLSHHTFVLQSYSILYSITQRNEKKQASQPSLSHTYSEYRPSHAVRTRHTCARMCGKPRGARRIH